MSTAVDLKSEEKVITRSINLNNIIVVDKANARFEEIPERVEYFKGILKEAPEKIPPIEVLLIQTGDTYNTKYALLDGLHRLSALKALSRTKIDANINHGKTITESDLDNKEIILYIQLKQCLFNSRHGLPLTMDERKASVKKFAESGMSATEITEETSLASRRTIFRWIQEIQNIKKNEKKEKIEKKLEEGVLQEEIAKEEGVSVDTVQRTKKSLTDRKNGKSKKTAKMPNDTFAVSPKESPVNPVDKNDSYLAKIGADDSTKKMELDGQLIDKPKGLFSTENLQKTLAQLNNPQRIEVLYQTIRAMEPDEDSELDMATYILPDIARKFKKAKEMLKNIDLAPILRKREMDLQTLVKTNQEISQFNKELLGHIELYKEEIKSRTTGCNYRCKHSKDRLGIEIDKVIQGAISDFKTNASLFTQQKSGKTTRAIFNTFSELRKSKENKIVLDTIAVQLTTDMAFSLCSMLEWSLDIGIIRDKIGKYADIIIDTLGNTEIDNKQINKRIAEIIRKNDYLKNDGGGK